MNPNFIKAAIFLEIAFFVFLLNIRPIKFSNIQPLQRMNDVSNILAGYHKTPNLLIDGLHWWHGPWIEEGVQAYRPLSSYLLWGESKLVLHFGFFPIIIIGALLLLLLSLLSATVAYQLTKSYWCSVLGGTLAAYVVRFDYGGIDQKWLTWYPVHHDLMAIAFALAATWAFLKWLELEGKTYIALCWTFFIAGLFCKEYLYVFPIMALVMAIGYKHAFTGKKQAAIHTGLMFCCVLIFYSLRQMVLPKPYMPHVLTKHMLITHSLLFWFHDFYLYLPSKIFWVPLLALIVFVFAGRVIKTPDRWTLLIGIVVPLFFVHLTVGILNGFWYFFDFSRDTDHLYFFFQMIFTFYTFWLVFKYRKTHSGVMAYLLMMLAYIPTFAYLGWHYGLAGCFFRSSVFWPVMAKLIWDDISPLFLPGLRDMLLKIPHYRALESTFINLKFALFVHDTCFFLPATFCCISAQAAAPSALISKIIDAK